MKKIEDIYFIDKNNAPQPHTIIENTTFKQNGYRITHFSMGANTAGSPERYHHIGIYTCNIGTLHLKHYIDRNSYEEIVLKPGDFWIRPVHTLVSWYAEEDTVFTVLSMRYTANFCDEEMLGKTISINHLIEQKESKISQKRLVNDEQFKLDAIYMGKNSRLEMSSNDNLILCSVEGKCALIYHNRQMIINSQQCFHTNMADKIVLLSATDAKLLLLKFVNQG